MAADPKSIKRRYEALKARKSVLEGHCEEIAEYCSPRHMGFTGYREKNEKRMTRIFDSTGVNALELLTAGLHGLATNPASKWFGLRVVQPGYEDNDSAKKWLSDVAQTMWAYMYAPYANLTTSLSECYHELGAFGTACIFIGERDAGGLLFQTRPLHECFIAENHENVVDTVYRKTTMTARQVAMQWPKSHSEDVKKMISANKPDDPVEIVHAVYPRSDRERGKRNRVNQPFASCYMEVKAEHLLEESGYPEFPYAVPRWYKLPGEEYGRSPAMTALPDVKMLQEMDKTTIKGAQKAVDPPLLVPDDSLVGPVRTVPGGLLYYRGDREITPLQTGSNFPITLEMVEARQNRVRNIFFADVLQIVSNTDMTATEVVQRTTERMRILGPIIGRIESELLGPLISRVFGILSRMGVMPPAPPDLAGLDMAIEFVSPIAMAQKQTEANALTSTLGVLLPMVEATQDPSILKPFKKDKLAGWAWGIFGGDPDLVHTQEELAEMAQAEAEAAQEQQQAMMAEQAAKAANQGAGALDKAASAQQKGADLSMLAGAA